MNQASSTPRALRCNIAIIGCRNAGKSSLLNAIVKENTAIVSDTAGTTTDAVSKPYELLPLGAVTFYDTAGLDDEGQIGKLRVNATKKILLRADLAVLVCQTKGLNSTDKETVALLQSLQIPFIIAFNQADVCTPKEDDLAFCAQNNIKFVSVSALKNDNIEDLKQLIVEIAPQEFKDEQKLAGDLINPKDTVVMVTPIDLSAPKGRLILPQVQILREILDSNAAAIALKESELQQVLSNQKEKPALVITDSQVVKKVAAIVPPEIPLTAFSILFARAKGDLKTMVEGARKIDNLKDGAKILIAEACSHHVAGDDIGKVKIPQWLQKYCGKNLVFSFCQGNDFPDNLEEYDLVIHCGACMLNRIEMKRRINECVRRRVAITNYGVAIAKTQGVLERVVKPFNL
ncbi:MAG: [Alphaproteobacteria bacterium]|nr:[FeFe] hydrogenase H-cluster maturation GTPase HydF [Alphaproteobacteria bacterium]